MANPDRLQLSRRDFLKNLAVVGGLIMGGLVAGSDVLPSPAEASRPSPEDDPILPYQDPGREYPERVYISPLPEHKKDGTGGGKNDNRELGQCGTVFVCEQLL